jgi:hypothetical protein
MMRLKIQTVHLLIAGNWKMHCLSAYSFTRAAIISGAAEQ